MSTNRIKFIYSSNSSSSSGISSAYIVIFIFFFIIGYFYYKMILKDISYDWNNKKCTPKYIFYSGFLKSTTGDPLKDTYNNFVECTDPTKTNTSGVNKFQVVFDTANTIAGASNSIMDYTDDIMTEGDRIRVEMKNRFSNVKERTNVIISSVNQLYNYQMKLYNILKMYFERIFLILDTLSTYIQDIKLFGLSNKKYNLTSGQEQLSTFIVSRTKEYENIYNGDITDAINNIKKIKKDSGANYDNANYDVVNNSINSAMQKYDELIDKLVRFDNENRTKLLDIDKECKILTDNNISYVSIFPFLKLKITNPELFLTNDITK